MLALCICLGFDCCWVFLWWVLPLSWLIEGHSVRHVLYSVVQMWTVCIEPDSSVCTRFWGFSVAVVQLFVLSNFSTYLYFHISPGLRLVWLPRPYSPPFVVICWWFLCWWVSSSICVLVFTASTLQVLWISKVKFVSLSQLLGFPLFGSNSALFTVPDFIVSLVEI